MRGIATQQQAPTDAAATETRRRERDARTAALEERERKAADLEAQVLTLRAERDAAVDRAVADAVARLREAHDAHDQLQQRTFEGERNVLASRIEALTQLVERQNAQIERLSRQQEQAYEKVQEIASRAVDGARRPAAGGAGSGAREQGEG